MKSNLGEVLISVRKPPTIAPTDSNVPTNTMEVKYLPKGTAIRARRVIQGLKIAIEQKVDLSGLEVNELLFKLDDIGRAREE